MPTNMYGPYDNFHPENSHVLPALMRRFHEAKKSGAKEVVCWGTGSPLREFLHTDDLAGTGFAVWPFILRHSRTCCTSRMHGVTYSHVKVSSSNNS